MLGDDIISWYDAHMRFGKVVVLIVIFCTILIYLERRPLPSSYQESFRFQPAGIPITQSSSSGSLVTYIYDGDTFRIDGGAKVRIIGIDAPEWSDEPDKRECFTNEAKDELARLIDGKFVRLEKDVSEVDRYGRLLRHVWVDNEFIGAAMVRGGFAKAVLYKPDKAYQSTLEDAQRYAQANEVGLWGSCSNTE